MKCYPNMKVTNQPHFDQLPQHWRSDRLKFHVALSDGGVWGEDADGGESDTIVLRSTEQTSDGRWIIDDPAIRKLTEREKKSCLLSAGDLIITKASGSSLHIGKTTFVDHKLAECQCCFSNFMQRIRLMSSLNPALAWYLFNSRIARDQFALLSNSTTGLANLNPTIIGDLVLPIPPINEQAAIAAFLDRETAKIDALVEEQRRLIALLAEKRQAVISHAVTKGLDPTVPMKDSGVEWLGEVPAHWSVSRLKHISPEITVGIVVEPSKYYMEHGVPALRSLNVRQGRIDTDNLVFISPESNESLRKSRLSAGDLVSVRTGQPGTTAVIPPDLDGCNCIDLIIIRRPIEGDENYLSWYLASDVAVRQFADGSGGAIQQHFNVSVAGDLVACVPSLPEQTKIANFVGMETQKIDNLIAEAQSATNLLQERRAALISAAVTGKIDVRGLVPAVEEAA